MLKELRAYLRQIKATAIIVPHSDSYFNEDLRPEDERLCALTGFTGSAGLAVVSQRQAVLFTDGRYTEQAKQQTSFKVIQINRQSVVSDWFDGFLKPNDVVVYDPWLISAFQIDRWSKVFAKHQATLLARDSNPIDILWTNRPKPQAVITFDYAEKHAGQSTQEKLKNVSEALKNAQIDAFVLCNPDTVSWLLNKRSNACKYNPAYLNRIVVQTKGKPFYFCENKAFMLKDKKVGIDSYETPMKIKQILQEAGAIVQNIYNPILPLQAVKNETEAKGMAQAALFDSIAVCRLLALLPSLKSTGTEWDVSTYLEKIRKENSAYQFQSFADISAVDKNAALPHYQATKDTAASLKNAKIYLLDTGGQYLTGTTDMTRTVCLSAPTAEMKKRYTQVLKGHIALGSAVFPKGTTAGQLDCLARQFLWADGVDYNHGTGHGIGCFLNVHETPPSVSPNGRDILQENMILSDEPGFYLEGKFGIRIENMMQVVKDKSKKGEFLRFEMLSFVPFCNDLIDKSLLTNEEKRWINNYYQQILTKV